MEAVVDGALRHLEIWRANMTYNANKLFVAAASAYAVIWVLCYALVAILPGEMMSVAGHMIHSDLGSASWTLTIAGFFVGLIAGSVLVGATAWVAAAIYNKMVS